MLLLLRLCNGSIMGPCFTPEDNKQSCYSLDLMNCGRWDESPNYLTMVWCNWSAVQSSSQGALPVLLSMVDCTCASLALEGEAEGVFRPKNPNWKQLCQLGMEVKFLNNTVAPQKGSGNILWKVGHTLNVFLFPFFTWINLGCIHFLFCIESCVAPAQCQGNTAYYYHINSQHKDSELLLLYR